MNITQTSTANTSATDERVPVQKLGQEDFLKLLVAQLKAQDPLNPKQDTEFVAQMAQVTSLELAKSTASEISGLRTEQQLGQAYGMLGREVEIETTTGATVSGAVEAVHLDGGVPKIIVGGLPFPVDRVISVTSPK